MIRPHAFAYAQARLQARYATRLGEPDWQRLGAVRRFGPYLQELRSTVVRDWVAGIAEGSDGHEIEQALRQQFRRTLAEVESWAPEPWRPAIAWVGWLPLLPLLQPLVLGETAPTWAARDPVLGPWLDAEGQLRPEALAAAGGAELLPQGPAERGLGERWLAGWRRRWPAVGRPMREELEGLVRLLERDWSAPAGPGDPGGGARFRLERLFHRRVLQPPMLFIYLALVALDLRRLRGELVGRALFEGEGSVP
jgi:hypothetical protein